MIRYIQIHALLILLILKQFPLNRLMMHQDRHERTYNVWKVIIKWRVVVFGSWRNGFKGTLNLCETPSVLSKKWILLLLMIDNNFHSKPGCINVWVLMSRYASNIWTLLLRRNLLDKFSFYQLVLPISENISTPLNIQMYFCRHYTFYLRLTNHFHKIIDLMFLNVYHAKQRVKVSDHEYRDIRFLWPSKWLVPCKSVRLSRANHTQIYISMYNLWV